MRASINLQSSHIASRFKPLQYPWIYVFLIMVAEFVTSYYLHAGILIHLCILGSLLVHSVMLEDKSVANLLTAMTVAPLIRILGLSTPLVHFSQITWFAIVSVPMFIAGITIARMQNLSVEQVGLSPPKKKYFPLEAAVVVLCIPVGFLEYYLLRPSALVSLNLHEAIAPALVLIGNTGFLEEVIFRGLLQYHATRIAGFHGIILVSVLFGVLHITNLVFWDAVLAAAVGLLFALVVRKTGSVWGMSLAHGMVNVTLFIIAPNLID
ncbi:MAG: CPBP family intramembrane glutamic endopeptidase [Dehalococcoidia bacterium]